MKQLLVLALALLITSSFVYSQTQGTANMLNTKHDFRVTTTKTTRDSIAGASDRLCSYCHTPHVPTNGIPTPLWARKAKVSQGWGVYASATLEATPVDPSDPTGGQNKNESNMCLSCHDGSALWTAAAYEKRPYAGSTSWTPYETRHVLDNQRLIGGTKYGNTLTHTHPINFDYDAAQALDDGLYVKQNAKYVFDDGTEKVGRLFNGKVQCSSCHNPHKTDTKMNTGTTVDGKMCVACHKK